MAYESPTYQAWQKLQRLPVKGVGHRLFSTFMVAKVPYFGTVLPSVEVMEPGHCEVTAPKWIGIHNHLGTFHAIAACNLAEVAMGMLAEATVPTSHRWIPKAMNVQYLGIANTGLRAVAKLDDLPEFASMTSGTDITIPVSVTDKSGKEVVHADITIWVTPK